MKIMVSSEGNSLDSAVSGVFGRCPYMVYVDADTLEATATANRAVSASGGAGVQAAQTVAREGAEAVLSGNVGPNAMQVLAASGISVYISEGMTCREAVLAYKAGELDRVTQATVRSDYAKPAGGRRGGGGGQGRGGGGGA